MAFENTELFDQIATDALKNYGWEDTDESKLIVLSENATYMVKNKETGEKDGVLRISRPGYHTLEELNSEMKWLNQINEYTPLIVANPIKGLNGEDIQVVKGNDGRNYYCVICEYLPGDPPAATHLALVEHCGLRALLCAPFAGLPVWRSLAHRRHLAGDHCSGCAAHSAVRAPDSHAAAGLVDGDPGGHLCAPGQHCRRTPL